MREVVYLDEEVALAVNGILDDFKGLPIIYMEINCVFHLGNATVIHFHRLNTARIYSMAQHNED